MLPRVGTHIRQQTSRFRVRAAGAVAAAALSRASQIRHLIILAWSTLSLVATLAYVPQFEHTDITRFTRYKGANTNIALIRSAGREKNAGYIVREKGARQAM